MKSVIMDINKSILLSSPKDYYPFIDETNATGEGLPFEVDLETQVLQGFPPLMYLNPKGLFNFPQITGEERLCRLLPDIIREHFPFPEDFNN